MGGPDPIAECDNCSRVIKYVVTYGARLDSNALVQMRVHDVNVLTDLDALNPLDPDPEKPVACDGSNPGTTDELNPSALEGLQSLALSFLSTSWLPVL